MSANAQPLGRKKGSSKNLWGCSGKILSLVGNEDTCDNFDLCKCIQGGKGAEWALKDHLSLYPKVRFARSEPFLTNLCLSSDRESVAP